MQCAFQLWIDATSFTPPLKELVFTPPIIRKAEMRDASGISFVLESLTNTHRDIFNLIRSWQSEHAEEGGT